MNKRLILIVLGLLMAVAITSCKSAPEEPTPEPVIEAPAVPVVEPAVSPVAEPEPVVEDPTPVEEPLPALSEEEKNALVASVMTARQAAIDASADILFPDEFDAVDSACEAALADFESYGNADMLKTAAKDAVCMYKALENAALADAEFNRIMELGFESDNPAAFDSACDAAETLRKMAENGASPAELLASSETLLGSYRGILDASFKKRADAQRADYVAVEKLAKDIKADIARKDDFGKARQLCIDADAAYACTSYEHALYSYKKATDLMMNVYNEVSRKRAEAESAMEAARARVAAAEKVALEADTIAPLPEDAEGFDEPETVDTEDAVSYEVLGTQGAAE